MVRRMHFVDHVRLKVEQKTPSSIVSVMVEESVHPSIRPHVTWRQKMNLANNSTNLASLSQNSLQNEKIMVMTSGKIAHVISSPLCVPNTNKFKRVLLSTDAQLFFDVLNFHLTRLISLMNYVIV